MGKRFLLTTLVFTGAHFTLFFSLNLLTLVLFGIFFTEEGQPNFVETGIIPALYSVLGALLLPGDLLFEKFRINGAASALNPLLRQATFLLSSLLWGLSCGFVWTRLRPRP